MDYKNYSIGKLPLQSLKNEQDMLLIMSAGQYCFVAAFYIVVVSE
ncbi:hypothetical protein KKH3_28990 [Pectobacterium actinidiae]|nr:hypothetical protein KKH3_28990 [Pectobacterium actinidiae]